MTVFASTSCLSGKADLWETLDLYKDAGLASAELSSVAPPALDGLAERLSTTGLELVVHNYFPPPLEPFVLNLASPDEDVRRRSLRFVFDSLELSAALGAAFYSVHAGFVNDPVGFDGEAFVFPPGQPGAQVDALRRFMASVNEAADTARSLGVRLLIENNVCHERHRGMLLLQETDEFVAFLQLIDRDEVGVLVDTGHLNVSARTLGFDRLEFVSRLAPKIGAFHLHDNAGVTDTHDPVTTGSWALEALIETGLAALPVIVEARFETVEALVRHVRWLEGLLGTPS